MSKNYTSLGKSIYRYFGAVVRYYRISWYLPSFATLVFKPLFYSAEFYWEQTIFYSSAPIAFTPEGGPVHWQSDLQPMSSSTGAIRVTLGPSVVVMQVQALLFTFTTQISSVGLGDLKRQTFGLKLASLTLRPPLPTTLNMELLTSYSIFGLLFWKENACGAAVAAGARRTAIWRGGEVVTG